MGIMYEFLLMGNDTDLMFNLLLINYVTYEKVKRFSCE